MALRILAAYGLAVVAFGTMAPPSTFDNDAAVRDRRPAVGLETSSSEGDTFNWTGVNGHDWGDPGNWDLGRVPAAGDSVNINPDASHIWVPSGVRLRRLQLSGGALDGGSISVEETLLWTDGWVGFHNSTKLHLLARSTTVIAGEARKTISSGPITNEGTVLMQGGEMWMPYGKEGFINEGTFEMQAEGKITGQGRFTNDGTFRAAAPVHPGYTTVGPFVNRGTLEVAENVVLDLPGGRSSFGGGARLLGRGRLRVPAGSRLDLEGVVEMPSGTLELAGGHLAGRGTIRGGTWRWTSGAVGEGSGTITIADATAMIMTDSAAKTIRSGTIVNEGAVIMEGGELSKPYANSRFINKGTFRLYGGARITGQGPFENDGTLTVVPAPSGSRAASGGSSLLNRGTVEVLGGVLSGTDGYRQVSGTTHLFDAAVLRWRTPVVIDGGTLAGNGRVDARLVNNSVVAPGLLGGSSSSPGDLSAKEYEQGPAGRLEIDIAAASRHDRLAVNGTARLQGSIRVNAIPPYQPPTGARFSVISYARLMAPRPRIVRAGESRWPTYSLDAEPNHAVLLVSDL